MVVITAKLTKKRIVAWAVLVGIILCAVIMVKGYINHPESRLTQAVDSVKSGDLEDGQTRVALLEGFGWTVENEPIEFMEVQIPDEFDKVYTEYNEIQKSQGMDLEKYAGKRVMRYTYRITNYPGDEGEVLANILIYKGKLVGGDVCSPKLNGFMHGLKKQ